MNYCFLETPVGPLVSRSGDHEAVRRIEFPENGRLACLRRWMGGRAVQWARPRANCASIFGGAFGV